MKNALDGADAAWEAHLAEAWRTAEPDDAAVAEPSAAFAARLDGVLRAERTARKARRVRAWLSLAAAAACAAVVALSTARTGRRGGAEPETAAATAAEEASEDGLDVAAAREAPVSEAFGELEDVLTELAALDFRYGWDDEDLEVAD